MTGEGIELDEIIRAINELVKLRVTCVRRDEDAVTNNYFLVENFVLNRVFYIIPRCVYFI